MFTEKLPFNALVEGCPFIHENRINAVIDVSMALRNLYSKRMQIEQSFRDVKSYHFGLGGRYIRTKCIHRWGVKMLLAAIVQITSKSPTKTIRTQCNHLFAAMVAFCKLELLKVKTTMNHFAIKQKLLLKANQIMFNELQLLKAAA